MRKGDDQRGMIEYNAWFRAGSPFSQCLFAGYGTLKILNLLKIRKKKPGV
jgi:hypothetical protein